MFLSCKSVLGGTLSQFQSEEHNFYGKDRKHMAQVLLKCGSLYCEKVYHFHAQIAMVEFFTHFTMERMQVLFQETIALRVLA